MSDLVVVGRGWVTAQYTDEFRDPVPGFPPRRVEVESVYREGDGLIPIWNDTPETSGLGLQLVGTIPMITIHGEEEIDALPDTMCMTFTTKRAGVLCMSRPFQIPKPGFHKLDIDWDQKWVFWADLFGAGPALYQQFAAYTATMLDSKEEVD
jgi:hypothetical protein